MVPEDTGRGLYHAVMTITPTGQDGAPPPPPAVSPTTETPDQHVARLLALVGSPGILPARLMPDEVAELIATLEGRARAWGRTADKLQGASEREVARRRKLTADLTEAAMHLTRMLGEFVPAGEKQGSGKGAPKVSAPAATEAGT
jgi:hypothetical protein